MTFRQKPPLPFQHLLLPLLRYYMLKALVPWLLLRRPAFFSYTSPFTYIKCNDFFLDTSIRIYLCFHDPFTTHRKFHFTTVNTIPIVFEHNLNDPMVHPRHFQRSCNFQSFCSFSIFRYT